MPHRSTIHKSVAERLDIDLATGRNRLRRARRVAGWSGFLSAALLLAYFGIRGDARIYMAGDVTPTHATFRGKRLECSACHSQLGQPALRFFTGNDGARSVQDQDCQHCHSAHNTHDHSPRMVFALARDCVMCHQEHRGHDALSRVADMNCRRCHDDLQLADNQETPLATQVRSFREHPEFALLRPVAGEPQITEHAMHQRVVSSDGRWKDRTALKFSHQAHLRSDGVLVPWQRTEGGRPTRKKLACADCHESSDDRSMGIVNFERHCSECHPLSFHQQLDRVGGPLTHSLFRGVREEVRVRLLAAANAERIDREDAFPPRLPNKNPDVQDESFQAAQNELLRSVKKGCLLCHQFPNPSGQQGEFDVEVEPPSIPQRWLPYSRFPHGAHDEYACVMCHSGASDLSKAKLLRAQDPYDDIERRLDSKTSADILIPSVQVCQQCHTTQRPTPWVSARADCVECHRYHKEAER